MKSNQPHRQAPRRPSEVLPGRLRELRKARRISQRQLAEQLQAFGLNVQQPAVALMEREPEPGKQSRKVSVDELVALGSIFGVPLQRLYDDAYGSESSWIDHQVRQMEMSPEEAEAQAQVEMAEEAIARLDHTHQPGGEE